MNMPNAKKYLNEMSNCIRCAYCFADCPTFTNFMWDSNSARGRIMIAYGMLQGEIPLTETAVEREFLCTLCGQCEVKCSAGIKILDVIKATRKDLAESGNLPESHKAMKEVFNEKENIYGEDQFIPEKIENSAEYIVFGGCVGNFRENESLVKSHKLFEKLGIKFTRIPEVCCGGVFADLGLDAPEKLAKKNIDAILSTGIKKIIFTCPKCFMTFKEDERYSELREKGIQMQNIVEVLRDKQFEIKFDKKVTYHDPCDLGRHEGIFNEPREVIKKVASNFKELSKNKDQSHCCGSGGGVRGAYTKLSIQIAKGRLKEALDMEAEVLLTECPSCLHNLRNAKKKRDNIEIKNISEFIYDLIEGEK